MSSNVRIIIAWVLPPITFQIELATRMLMAYEQKKIYIERNNRIAPYPKKKKCKGVVNLQCENAATAESNAASNRAPSASKQYMSCTSG